MKIYTNFRHEIKAINYSDDENLTEIEVDRESVFGNYSDFRILNYCYNYGAIYPAIDIREIDRFDFEYKISDLEAAIKCQDQLALDQELRIAMLELNSTI